MRILFEKQLSIVRPVGPYIKDGQTAAEIAKYLRRESKTMDPITFKWRYGLTPTAAKKLVADKIAEFDAHLGQRIVFALVEGELTDSAAEEGGKVVNVEVKSFWENELDTLHERFEQSPIPSTQTLPRLRRIA